MNKPYTLSVDARGAEVTYQWQRNDTNIIGATGASYTVPLMNRDLIGRYRVIVTGICGTKASNVATITALQELVIQSQTDSIFNGNLTRNISIFVQSAGVDPLKYQWYKNGEKIDGATNATYFKSDAMIGDIGSYWCEISDRCDTITSKPIQVKLVPVSVEEEGSITGIMNVGLQQIMPNPASDQVQARIMSMMPGEAMIEVHSILGSSMIPSFNVSLESGYTMIPINTESLLPGTYLCKVTMNGMISTQTFSIVR
jgi:hypothetical protein